MQAPEQEPKGTAGATFAKGNFEAIGWGVAENYTHDLGTDLFVMVLLARDPAGSISNCWWVRRSRAAQVGSSLKRPTTTET